MTYRRFTPRHRLGKPSHSGETAAQNHMRAQPGKAGILWLALAPRDQPAELVAEQQSGDRVVENFGFTVEQLMKRPHHRHAERGLACVPLRLGGVTSRCGTDNARRASRLGQLSPAGRREKSRPGLLIN